MPALCKVSRCQFNNDLPCTSKSGFGKKSVNGRMRSPRPAASNKHGIEASIGAEKVINVAPQAAE